MFKKLLNSFFISILLLSSSYTFGDEAEDQLTCTTMEEQASTEEVAQSTTEEQVPTEEVAQSTTEEQVPTEEVAQSTTEEQVPTEEVAQSTTEEQAPTEEVAQSTTEEQAPTEEVAQSTTEEQTSPEQMQQIVHTEQEIVAHVQRCLTLAKNETSNLISDVLSIPGMTSNKVKHLLNNLCSLPNTSYLEVGISEGASFIGALYGNSTSVTCAVGVDDWSGSKDTKDTFLKNAKQFIPKQSFHLFEQDPFSLDLKTAFPSPVNVYFYDGKYNESVSYQELPFTFFNDVFDDVFIAVIDDWNWSFVREGTAAAFKKLNYTILFEKNFYTAKNGDLKNWWNGIYVAVIKKNNN